MKKLLTIMLLLLAGTAWGGDFEDGYAAYLKNNYPVAIAKLKLAAAQGNAGAQTIIGSMYYYGRGVIQDYAEAFKWYKLAAAQGHAQAQFDIGLMYRNGEGVLPNDVRAHMWFNLSAVGGDAAAAQLRGLAAAEMTTQQIAEAQKLARECQARNFKHCD